MQSRGVKIVGVILNNNDGATDLAAQTNPEVLKRYLKVPILGVFPYYQGLLKEGMDRELLADIFAKHIDTDKIVF